VRLLQDHDYHLEQMASSKVKSKVLNSTDIA